MNNSDQLLETIAADCHIERGAAESVADFQARIIYSVLSRQAYAALFDNQPVSIDHFKDRINDLMKIYAALYEINLSTDLASEIYDLYLNAGYFYHAPYRIAPSMFRVAESDGVLFLRGIAPNQKVYMSGAGFYLPSNDNPAVDITINQMFALNDRTLLETWEEIIRRAKWRAENFPADAEFLRTTPPFSKGYWQQKPDRDGSISIAQSKSLDAYSHYLYRFDGENFLCSQQPSWRHYRLLSNACLASRGTLPPIKYKIDGAIVRTEIGYLPPPPELNLLKLYGWSQTKPSDNFNRTFDAKIFFVLKNIFERLGYTFNEEERQ